MSGQVKTVKSKTIEVEQVGPVLFEKSRRARRLNISLKPFKGVRVATPLRASFQEARQFLEDNIDWVRKQAIRIRQFERDHEQVYSKSREIDWDQARAFLIQRLEELARQHGFSYNRVFIRNQKTRWGSCSQQNNINLNIALVTLPQHLIDYVILHELVHTRIKNHSRLFWSELDKVVGDGRGHDKKLRKYQPVRKNRVFI